MKQRRWEEHRNTGLKSLIKILEACMDFRNVAFQPNSNKTEQLHSKANSRRRSQGRKQPDLESE